MSRERDTFEFMAARDASRRRAGDDELRGNDSARSDLVDLALELRAEKPLAIAVVDPAKPGGAWVWLPKSQIEIERKGRGAVVVTLPAWLARDKGLV